MNDWRKEVYQDKDFLYYFDILGHTPLTVEIEGYEHIEAFNPGPKEKGDLWCLKFKGKKKKLGINVTNGHLIEQHHGSDPDKWRGKKIVLRVATCKGEKCIRVDAKPGKKLPSKCPEYKYDDETPEQK